MLAHLGLLCRGVLWSGKAADAAGESAGGLISDQHAETRHAVRVEHPASPFPVAMATTLH